MPYLAIPVEEARAIGQHFEKDRVVILAYDAESQRTAIVTWGRQPSDKEAAAHVGDRCAELLGCRRDTVEVHQDFRREGEAAAAVDAMVMACRAADHALGSLLACRNGISDDLIRGIRGALQRAIAAY
jgi:hypothetical protein